MINTNSMEPLYTAIPEKSYTTILVLLFLTVSLVIFAFLIQMNKFQRIKGAYKQVGFLLSGFLGLLFLSTLLLSIWDSYRIQTVELYEEYLTCYQGKIPYKDIARAGIYTDKQQSFINPQLQLDQSKMLVIERKGKPTAVFAAEYYDVEVLTKRIREKMGR